MKTHALKLVFAAGLAMTSLTQAQTVTRIDNPYANFGLPELQNAKFTGVNSPADGVNQNTYLLTLDLGGIEAYSVERRVGNPTISQAGYSAILSGTTAVNNTEIMFWDGFTTLNYGAAAGTNAILLQSSAASGDTFDMALVFDIQDPDFGPQPSWPVSGELSNVFLVCDPTSGSFTMDSAIAASRSGSTTPHIPEPSSMMLICIGALGFSLKRRR